MYDKTDDPHVILDRMLQLTKMERLLRGSYSCYIGDTEPDAPCGGNQFCAIGSMWYAAGAFTTWGPQGRMLRLDSVDETARYRVLDKRPGLNAAYEALDQAANQWYKDNHGEEVVPNAYDRGGFPSFTHAGERLFEATKYEDPEEGSVPFIDDDDFADIVNRAKALL